ncbi:MAG TPA: antitoxin family protein [Blastocatellia bacterium]|nr:antitoxin family protein [Blastocatellia bacterium]
MTTTIEAVYEGGVLRLKEPVALADGTIVEVTITTSEPSGEKKTPAEILSSIASLPTEGDGQGVSGRDHDKILYGEKPTP